MITTASFMISENHNSRRPPGGLKITHATPQIVIQSPPVSMSLHQEMMDNVMFDDNRSEYFERTAHSLQPIA